jgi:hypothetical protein
MAINKNIFKTDFCYRGAREYVQGGDIFNSVVEIVCNEFDIYKINKFNFSWYKFLNKNANIYISDSIDNFNRENVNSILTFSYDRSIIYVIMIGNDSEIKCTYNFDEDFICNNLILKKNSIEIFDIGNYSFIDVAIQINKCLLSKTISKTGKWIVTKLDGDSLSELLNSKINSIKIEDVNTFNDIFTRSKVLIGDGKFVNLYFSLI